MKECEVDRSRNDHLKCDPDMVEKVGYEEVFAVLHFLCKKRGKKKMLCVVIS